MCIEPESLVQSQEWERCFFTGMTWEMHSWEELFELNLERLWRISTGMEEGKDFETVPLESSSSLTQVQIG